MITSGCGTVAIGDVVTCSVQLGPSLYPESASIQVAHADLSSFGGATDVSFYRSGDFGGDFDLSFNTPAGTTPGVKTIPLWVVDAEGRRFDGAATVTIVAR